MNHSPFASIRTIRWPLLALVHLLVVGTALRLPGDDRLSADHPPAKPNKKLDFKGIWDGVFLNNLGQTGKGTYKFHDEKDGRLEVSVSWRNEKMELESMEVKGERLGLDAMRLEGTYDCTTYRYIGRMEGSGLVLQYLSIDGTGKSGSGVSKLTRQKSEK